MLYQPQPNQQIKRKTKEGDWICIQCFNYNYAFRNYCNRCRCQQKTQNQRLLNAIGQENYGQKSFPSVLFIQYTDNDTKQNIFQPSNMPSKNTPRQKAKKIKQFKSVQVNNETESILTQNIWISNLIDQ